MTTKYLYENTNLKARLGKLTSASRHKKKFTAI